VIKLDIISAAVAVLTDLAICKQQDGVDLYGLFWQSLNCDSLYKNVDIGLNLLELFENVIDLGFFLEGPFFD